MSERNIGLKSLYKDTEQNPQGDMPQVHQQPPLNLKLHQF